MTPLYEVRVRRDAHTINHVIVPQYEIAILQELFGTENVQNAEGKSLDESIGASVGAFEAGDEYDRFCAKYGAETVEAVYGRKGAKMLDKAINDGEKSRKAVEEKAKAELAAAKAKEKADAEAEKAKAAAEEKAKASDAKKTIAKE